MFNKCIGLIYIIWEALQYLPTWLYANKIIPIPNFGQTVACRPIWTQWSPTWPKSWTRQPPAQESWNSPSFCQRRSRLWSILPTTAASPLPPAARPSSGQFLPRRNPSTINRFTLIHSSTKLTARGRGRWAVSREVASDTRDLRFESSHRQFCLLSSILKCTVLAKTQPGNDKQVCLP